MKKATSPCSWTGGRGDRCLAGQPDSETRRLWLEALLEAELTDIALGGIDLAPSAWDALLEQATDADWSWMEQRVRAELQKSGDWAREALVNLLSERRERTGQAEDAGCSSGSWARPSSAFLLIAEERSMRPCA
jgi:hypothetical protein